MKISIIMHIEKSGEWEEGELIAQRTSILTPLTLKYHTPKP